MDDWELRNEIRHIEQETAELEHVLKSQVEHYLFALVAIANGEGATADQLRSAARRALGDVTVEQDVIDEARRTYFASRKPKGSS
ncbi:MAG TPA: hypothetical protein VFS96_00445 [Nitrolancea sp.]|nr:hypothetical protein [Nitrolancea sp.]